MEGETKETQVASEPVIPRFRITRRLRNGIHNVQAVSRIIGWIT